MTVLPDHETAWFTDSKGNSWYIDVHFLLSRHECVYGRGCKGLDSVAHHGCCDDGAYFQSEAGDEAGVRAAVEAMPDSAFTNAKEVRERWVSKVGNDRKTRKVKGACVFINTPDHPNGAGCALHQFAMSKGDHPLNYKPFICSWVPLNQQEDDDGAMYVGPFEQDDWFGEENPSNDWYCLEDEGVYTAGEPLFMRMQVELLSLFNGDNELLTKVNAYLNDRWNAIRDVPSVRVEIGKRHGDGVPKREGDSNE